MNRNCSDKNVCDCLDMYERLTDQSQKQINRAWKAYAILGGLLAVFITYGELSDFGFKSDIREEIRTEKDIVQKQVLSQIEKEFQQKQAGLGDILP